MGNCGNCVGSCEKCSTCGGCGQGLELTMEEIRFLQELGQYSFLPVARKMGDLTPIFLEQGQEQAEHYSLILQCLEKKGLISLDYDKPMKAFDDAAYAAYPIRGSMSLTQRGQAVLEMLEIQGAGEEI